MHRAQVNAGDVLADDAKGKQLRATEDDDDGCEEGEPLRCPAFNERAPGDEDQHPETNNGRKKACKAGEPQRPGGKSREHIEAVHCQLAEGVVGTPFGTFLEFDRYVCEARGGPAQQHVDRHVRAAILGERVAQLGAEYPKGLTFPAVSFPIGARRASLLIHVATPRSVPRGGLSWKP